MADYRGPGGARRPTNSGPLVYDAHSPPQSPDHFTPPKITDITGSEKYWKQWTDPGQFNFGRTDVPPKLSGITGLYYPEHDWVVVDNRMLIHHTVQLDMSHEENNTPSAYDNTVIVFATDYVGDKGENIIGMQNLDVSLSDVDYWEEHVSIPEKGSLLIHDEEDVITTTPEIEHIYKIVYPLYALGVGGDALARLVHKYRRMFEAERAVYMSRLYKELSFSTTLPDIKVERDIVTRRPDR